MRALLQWTLRRSEQMEHVFFPPYVPQRLQRVPPLQGLQWVSACSVEPNWFQVVWTEL